PPLPGWRGRGAVARQPAFRSATFDGAGGELTRSPQRLRTPPPSPLILRGFSLARSLYPRTNMKIVHHLVAAPALLTATTLVSAGARADEAAPFGISFDGYLAPTWDH